LIDAQLALKAVGLYELQGRTGCIQWLGARGGAKACCAHAGNVDVGIASKL